MANMKFNTPAGQTVGRELLIAYLNTGTKAAPVWSAVGKRVEDSSIEMDWGNEGYVDIFGVACISGRRATKTQTFEPCQLDSGDAAQLKVWRHAIAENDVLSLINLDMLIVHAYAGTANSAVFAERYSACAALPSALGGEGGGSVGMPIEITYGGTRTIGTASIANGVVLFTPDEAKDPTPDPTPDPDPDPTPDPDPVKLATPVIKIEEV